ncbi:MAG: hypothetical protein A2622_14100 [Bdellovibrionales bacterium RIFCSPHIGHO2_01_FULL_40_29]|nr:MAG: hypothetical protein A2622_14100 [Bdellovibrionales bacterium RIFCSPHIGHO2_01_FULL_40_29]OFZ33653.1 MAG: hypothetical protein A3D17_11710 [Bdellovibrionales bacterium RIFCSPHIGHO2_02_FULL_40_15]
MSGSKYTRKDLFRFLLGSGVLLSSQKLFFNNWSFLLNTPKESTPVFSIFIATFQQEQIAINDDTRLIDLVKDWSEKKQWVSNYTSVRNYFIDSFKLQKSVKFSEHGQSLYIINQWASRDDFNDFCQSTRITSLLEKLSPFLTYKYELRTNFPDELKIKKMGANILT